MFKLEAAYGLRISDWSSDVCSSDLSNGQRCSIRECRPALWHGRGDAARSELRAGGRLVSFSERFVGGGQDVAASPALSGAAAKPGVHFAVRGGRRHHGAFAPRSEEHTSELQSLMRISYAVFCL